MRVTQIQRAQHLRANMTMVEVRVWQRLRAKQLGVKFRRQHPIGPYIVDFACVRARLAVELDGDTHDKAYDSRRDAWLGSQGWRVMRIALSEVDLDVDGVIDCVSMELQEPGSMLTYGQRFPDHPSRPPQQSWGGAQPY